MAIIKNPADIRHIPVPYRYLQRTRRWVLELPALAAITSISGAIYSYNAIRYAFPLGFGGLFALMAEVLASNHYRLPVAVPFYGPGSIPLAYPPFAIYLMAFATKGLHLSTIEYLRFAPVIFSTVSLIPLYLFFGLLTRSRIQSFIAVLCITFSLEIYQMQATAGGVVRALGFLFMNSSLLFTYMALSKQQGKLAALAASFLGLTVLTHLSYAFFLCLSIGILFLVEFRSARQFKFTAMIFSGGFLFATPWLFADISSYGYQIILSAFHSHGNSDWFWITYTTIRIPRSVVQFVITFASAPILGGFALVGLLFTILRKKWLLPLWFVATSVFVSEGERYLIVLEALLASLCIFEIGKFTSSFVHHQKNSKIIFSALISCLLFLSVVKPVEKILEYSPAISGATFELRDWFREWTQPDSRYLYLMTNEDSAEWLPYLLQRTPVVGHWGAEWIGTYETQRNLLSQLDNCVQEQSFNCVADIMDRNGLKPDYLIIPRMFMDNLIVHTLQASPGWVLAYTNGEYQVWQRK